MKLNEAIKQVLIPEATTNKYKGGIETVSASELHSQYDEKLKQFENGYMSAEEWSDYCQNLLSRILNDNKDVMLRLKLRQF